MGPPEEGGVAVAGAWGGGSVLWQELKEVSCEAMWLLSCLSPTYGVLSPIM